MAINEPMVSADALMAGLILLLYAPVCFFCCRALVPRLSPTGKVAASAMLATMTLILVVALENTPRWELKGWLWHFDQEWNIPSTFASTQLALVAGAALLTAWLARARGVAFRLYLLGIGLLFFLLAWDESYSLHEANLMLETVYIVLGAAVAAATILLAARAPRSSRVWHGCLLLGMALNLIGAMAIDALPQICDRLGFLRLEGCLRFYNLEEALELLGVWLILLAALGFLSGAAPRLRRRYRLALFALPLFWLAALTRGALLPRLELQLLSQRAEIQFESGARLLGYELRRRDDSIRLRLHPSAWRSVYEGLGFALHLVDQASGESVASSNVYARRQHRLLLAPSYAHVYRQFMTLEIPPSAPANRAYWLVLSLWRDDGGEFQRQRVLASDHRLLSETEIVLDELALPTVASNAPAPGALARFETGFALVGVDRPGRAAAGEELVIRFAWRSEAEGSADYTQFLHLVHDESGAQWGFDQPPLGRRLPTRLWYSGLADSETWRIPLPPDLAPGDYAVFSGLYHAQTLERLPARDADGAAFANARVALGVIAIEG